MLHTPARLLLGPGPSNSHPAVTQALSLPQLGYLDPVLMQDVLKPLCELLRYVFRTTNKHTFPITGSGMTAWETVISNLVESEDGVLVCTNGFFGDRCTELVGRYTKSMYTLVKPWGKVFELEEVESTIARCRPSLVWLCHAETSTGTLQPMAGIGDACRRHGCLLVLDCVTSLGTSPVLIDDWKVDVAYSCSQKGLACPPGCSPITLNDRAMQKITTRWGRRIKPSIPWSMDIELLSNYYFPEEGKPRVYHHTVSSTMWYALLASLRAIEKEGIEEVWRRHREVASELYEFLESLNFKLFVENKENRTPALTTALLPDHIKAQEFLKALRETANIEIGGALGHLAGRVVRIGTMGYNARGEAVSELVKALKSLT